MKEIDNQESKSIYHVTFHLNEDHYTISSYIFDQNIKLIEALRIFMKFLKNEKHLLFKNMKVHILIH